MQLLVVYLAMIEGLQRRDLGKGEVLLKTEKFVRHKINKELRKVRKELLQTSGLWEYAVVH